ncbi:universal stress protein [Litchfieldia salsa]|uniref:Nucleotide-binding universal stress protein, UspA family n=1 Tax=Litchfieldia salsa TaxID=930152 RepID=A0A1H0WTM7_9BACI|nr:universal stress protein [Litchfieldia salsa]SDP93939.1 Nucleotide-binding universal stress protein, UspA family [Litchfieldia salsa]
MFKKILLAWDGSEHSVRAAKKAIEIATCTEGSHVVVVYVKDTDKSKSEVLQNWNSIDISSPKEEKIKQIDKMAKESNIRYEVETLTGDPGIAIVEYANKHQFDVVVVGSRGLNTLQEMVLGSVSHKVAKRANCPVMIIK